MCHAIVSTKLKPCVAHACNRRAGALQEAAAAGCCMAFLPECFNFIGRGPAETVAQAQPLACAAMQRYQQLARCVWLALPFDCALLRSMLPGLAVAW